MISPISRKKKVIYQAYKDSLFMLQDLGLALYKEKKITTS